MEISFVPPAAPIPSLKWGPALLAPETFLFPFLCLCARSSDDCFLIRHGKEGKEREGGSGGSEGRRIVVVRREKRRKGGSEAEQTTSINARLLQVGQLRGGIRRISKYVEKYIYIPSRKFLDYCLICFNFFGHNLRNLFYEHVAARSNECAFLIFHFLDLGPSFLPRSKGGSCMVERARSSPGKEWTRGKGKGEYSPQEEKPR